MFNLVDFKLNVNVGEKQFREELFCKRIQMIDIAIGWSGNTTQGSLVFNNIWTYKIDASYVVSLGKYGKEYYQLGTSGHGVKNCNDMRPSIIHKGEVLQSVRGRFYDIFHQMEILKNEGKEDALKAFAVLFFRNALLLDHSIVEDKYYYNPPSNLIQFICQECPKCENVPTEVYIHFLDAIGLNEDVKYKTQGKLKKTNGIGRENNMKTYVYNICCILGKECWSDFVYKLMHGRGIAAITDNIMAQHFPELGIEFKETTKKVKPKKQLDIVIDKIMNQEPNLI